MHVVIDAVGIRDGGGAALFTELSRSLPRQRPDWRWTLCVLPQPARAFATPEVSSNAEVVVAPYGDDWMGRLRWLAVGLPRLLSAVGADILYSFANLGPLRCPAPTILFVQQMKALTRNAGTASQMSHVRLAILNRLVFFGIERASRIVVQSQHMKDLISLSKPEYGQKIEVVASAPLSEASGDVRGEVRNAILSAPQPRLFYPSLFRPHKNHRMLLQAFADFRRREPSASLLLTVPGPGPACDDTAVAEAHKAAADAGLDGGVVWLGVLSSAEVEFAYRHATAMVFPSLAESFGLPLVEALRAGCPILAADLPYAREIAADAALYFDPLAPASLAAAMGEVCGNTQALLENLSRAGLERSALFSSQKSAESLCEIFERARHSEGRRCVD